MRSVALCENALIPAGVARTDLLEGCERALRDLRRGFAAGRRGAHRVRNPGVVPPRIERTSLLRREAFPAAVVDLDQAGNDLRRNLRCDQRGRFRRAPERRAVDGGEPDAGEALAELARLLAAVLRQRELTLAVERVHRGRGGLRMPSHIKEHHSSSSSPSTQGTICSSEKTTTSRPFRRSTRPGS